ncbi:DUF3833 domain-containing protein [Alteromonas sp. KUL49]|uniref:DUF3833 domain-containing protein n=1 Tax=Alteromonas sp. KUL49 TaxID=2480798 RepID=UPI00102F28F3|nr:DUF3833 domain-containing protein [Alteromonas sp. KUL49]TAP41651.1 DUF3833 domain-containing protein [Alteromonas sp. KUL49]GEA10755.1 hypothetical protein KUL49_11300 [Alteromonas sp. KUL49]
MKNFLKIASAVFGLVFLNGCSIAIVGSDYKEQTPAFNLNQFFDGQVKAWGIVQNRSGEVVQRFVVDIRGSNANGVLTLDETFEYDLGEGPKTRVWEITQKSDGTFEGSASDIASTAIGMSYGNAFNFRYAMDLPVGDTTYLVQFDDWFWAFDDTAIMNRSYIKKFGVVMAEVTIFMQRQS